MVKNIAADRTADRGSALRKMVMSSAVLRFGGIGAAAFLLTTAAEGGARLPAAAALVAAASPGLAAAAFAGGLCGILVSGTLGEMLVDVCAMLAIMIVKFIFTDILGKRCTAALSLSAALLSYIISGVAVSVFIGGVSGGGFVAILFQGTLCAAAAYAFSTAYGAFAASRLTAPTQTEAGSLGAVYMLTIGALTTVHIGEISVGRIVGLAAVLMLSRQLRGSGYCAAERY